MSSPKEYAQVFVALTLPKTGDPRNAVYEVINTIKQYGGDLPDDLKLLLIDFYYNIDIDSLKAQAFDNLPKALIKELKLMPPDGVNQV